MASIVSDVEYRPSLYRYYTLSRPPAPGAVPRGVINAVCFDKRKTVYDTFPTCNAWGYVEYDRELTFHEIAEYELISKDRPFYT